MLGTAAAKFFHLPVETIGSRFGEIPSSLPMPALPHLSWAAMPALVGPALTIAMLAGIESLLCATVADGMIEGRHRSNMELVAQGVSTFLLTVAVDLTVAIEVGMGLAVVFFMKNMPESVQVNAISEVMAEENAPTLEPAVAAKRRYPKGVDVFDIQGPLFFGAAQRFEESIRVAGNSPRALILMLENVHHVDATGIHALEQIAADCRRRGARLFLVGRHAQTRQALERSGLLAVLGEGALQTSLDSALELLQGAGENPETKAA